MDVLRLSLRSLKQLNLVCRVRLVIHNPCFQAGFHIASPSTVRTRLCLAPGSDLKNLPGANVCFCASFYTAGQYVFGRPAEDVPDVWEYHNRQARYKGTLLLSVGVHMSGTRLAGLNDPLISSRRQEGLSC